MLGFNYNKIITHIFIGYNISIFLYIHICFFFTAIPPELLSTFIEQTLQPGVAISLHCVASGTPPPRVTWLLDGGPLLPRGGYVFGSYLDSSGDVISHLNITVARVQHGGLYTCLAKNTLGSAQHSAALNIYGKL